MSGGRVVLILLVCSVMAAGCSDKNSVPKGIISRDRMERVMWDMAQADQYAALYLTKDSAHIDRKAETMRLYAEVLRLHDVTPEEFRKSYRYYLDHPELNQLLFDSVIARGGQARTEMYDRPSTYRAPVPPANMRPAVGPGSVGAGTLKPGAFVPGSVRPGGPGGSVRPGAFVPGRGGVQADFLQRMREAAARRRDSVMRARSKRDTTGRTKGRHSRA